MKRGIVRLTIVGLVIGLFGSGVNPAAAAPSKAATEQLMTDQVKTLSPTTTKLAAPQAAVASAAAAGMPAGYSVSTVDSGFKTPVKVIWSPATSWASAGERFLADHTGIVYRTNVATNARTVLLDLTGHINTYGDRGLSSIAVDPDYATNNYLYLSYTFENDASKPTYCKTNTFTRVTVNATGASPETTILGNVHGGGTCSLDTNGEPQGSACPSATTNDCISSDFWSHSAGDIRFASDKTIYLSYGDNANYNSPDPVRAYRAQNLDSFAGKVLHITRTGAGLTTNPYAAGRTDTNRSKVWSRGDRNQYRFSLINDTVIGGNVGWYQWEEIEKSDKGGNNGWPCYEGAGKSTSGYETSTECKGMYAANTPVQAPLISVDHKNAAMAVIGGTIVTGNKYPADLAGAYLYGDYVLNNFSVTRFDSAFKLTQAPSVFATNTDAPVDIEMGPDGYLYYISITTGQLRRLDYSAGPVAGGCKTDEWKLQYYPNPDRIGSPTHEVCESATGAPKLTKKWGVGAPPFTPADASFPKDYFSVAATCTCTFSGGTANFSATADDLATVLVDGVQLLSSKINTATASKVLGGSHIVTVNFRENYGNASFNVDWNQPSGLSQPGLHIAAPLEGQVFASGTTVNYTADVAVDYKGDPLPPSAVSWSIEKNHCYNPTDCHVHFLKSSTGLTGSFVMDSPDVAPDTDFITVKLSATDPSTGLSQTTSVDIYY